MITGRHQAKLALLPQRSVQNIEPRLPPEVEDPEQVILLRGVFRAADLVARDVEGEELAQAGRLYFDHSFGIVGVVKRNDVEAQAVANVLRSPDDPFGEVVTPAAFRR